MALKARVLTKFPARVLAETGLAIERENGEYTFSLDFGSLSVADTIPDDTAAYLVVLTPGETADDPDVLETVSVETFLNETNAVNQDRQIISGAGLTGGGDLSADRTLAVGAGAGITVNADDVALGLNGLTEDTTPDSANDFLVTYDASASAHKKAKITNVIGSVGSVTALNGQTGPITLSAAGTIFNLGLAASVAGNALTIALKDAAGADPSASSAVVISFRNVTASTGTPSTLTVAAATSLTVSSGSTLGTTNSTPFHLLVVGFNDGGTFRLGVINTSASGEIYPVTSIGIASSTAEGGAGAADSAGVFYTGTAVTSKAYVVLARLSYNATPPATAGAWANGPDRIQLVHADFKYPGDIVQVRRASSTANTVATTTIPIDDTVPQDTEGASSSMSVSITPTSQANWLRIQTLHYLGTASAAHAITALFQNVNPSAIAASLGFNSTASTVTPQMIDVTILANSVTSNAFTTRFGANSGNAGLNGNAATRYLGGTLTSWISVAEIQG